MNKPQQQVLFKIIAIFVFFLAILIFLCFISAKIERIETATYNNNYQTIKEETDIKIPENIIINKEKNMASTAFFIGAIIILLVAGAVYLIKQNKNANYQKILAIVAEEHQLAYHQEHSWSTPSATGSDKQGLIMIEVETQDDNSKRSIISLNIGYSENATITTEKENECQITGSEKVKTKINKQLQAQLKESKGTWNIKAGEIRYEHYSIVRTPEELSKLISTAKKLREALTQVKF